MDISRNFENAIRTLRITHPQMTKTYAVSFLLNFLGQNHEKSHDLIKKLHTLITETHKCNVCNNLSSHEICEYCSSRNRVAKSSICIVETSLDIKHFRDHKGTFFVIDQISDPLLGKMIQDEVRHKLINLLISGIKEVVIALPMNQNVEPTIELLLNLCEVYGVQKVTRVAMGLPYGGLLSNVDPYSIDFSYKNRLELKYDK